MTSAGQLSIYLKAGLSPSNARLIFVTLIRLGTRSTVSGTKMVSKKMAKSGGEILPLIIDYSTCEPSLSQKLFDKFERNAGQDSSTRSRG